MAQQKYTAARKEGNRKWDAQNLDRISIALPKGQKDKIKAHAEKRRGKYQRLCWSCNKRNNAA